MAVKHPTAADGTFSASGAAAWNEAHTIEAGTITLAMQANMDTASLVYRKTAGAGAPEVNTLATLKTDLGLTGTNSGDQTTIVGITGTIAQFNTACTDADFATGGGTATGTNTGDQTSVSGNSGNTNALQSATTTVNVSSATAPSSGQVLTATSGATATWQTPASGGKFLQQVSFDTGAVATGTTTIPQDNTIPQNTEGTEFMTLAITPLSATSTLIIEAGGFFGSVGANEICFALFQDSVANALGCIEQGYLVTSVSFLTLNVKQASASTTLRTYKIRCGGHAAGTITFNGYNGARLYGGVLNSYIRITEVEV